MNTKPTKPCPSVVAKALAVVSRAVLAKGVLWVAYRVGRSERTVQRWADDANRPSKNESARLLSVLKEYAS